MSFLKTRGCVEIEKHDSDRRPTKWASSTELLRASVQHRRRHLSEIADLQLAAFFDEHNFEVEVRAEILTLLQFSYANPLSPAATF